METLTIDLPAMYGDHHVIEVKRILLEIPGVKDVYASSAFQIAEITFDPNQTGEEVIKARLDEAGYLGELLVPVEADTPVTEHNGNGMRFRHSAAYEVTGDVVSFTHRVPYSGRPLWPCPGMGPLDVVDEGE